MMFTCYIIRNNVLGSAVPVVISIAGYAAIYIIYCALAVRNGNTLLRRYREAMSSEKKEAENG